MPRLRNTATGTTVEVSDETAALLTGYEPVSAQAKAPAKKSAAKK